MDAVTISVSRDAASVFDVTFRLLPANNGSYGRIIDRTYSTSTLPVPKVDDSGEEPEAEPTNGGDDSGDEQGDAPAVGLMSRTFGR